MDYALLVSRPSTLLERIHWQSVNQSGIEAFFQSVSWSVSGLQAGAPSYLQPQGSSPCKTVFSPWAFRYYQDYSNLLYSRFRNLLRQCRQTRQACCSTACWFCTHQTATLLCIGRPYNTRAQSGSSSGRSSGLGDCWCCFIPLKDTVRTHSPTTDSLAHPPTRSLARSLTDSFTDSLAHTLTPSLTHALTHPPTHSLTHSLARLPTHSLARPLTHSRHSLTRSLVRSPTHWLTHSHSLTHSLHTGYRLLSQWAPKMRRTPSPRK